MTRPRALLLTSVALIAAMAVLVPWLTHLLGPTWGYLSVFCLYWFGFCLPVGWVFQGRTAWPRLGFAIGRYRWIPWALAAQVAVVAAANWTMLPGAVPMLAISLALLFGALNGFAEEFVWRGAYLAQGGTNTTYMAYGAVLFGLWHVPLALAQGITYPGGPVTMILGAFGLGVFWTYIAFLTGRTGWITLAHMLTNAVAFVGLIATNFVAVGP